MKDKTFELGPLQKLWIKSLRKHPERQGKGNLGRGNGHKYTACCLGELHLCYHRLNKLKLPFENKQIKDGTSMGLYLNYSSEKYGLYTIGGQRIDEQGIHINGMVYDDLGTANDDGVSWTGIADYIEAHADKIFTKSV